MMHFKKTLTVLVGLLTAGSLFAAQLKVGLVADYAGLNDRSFNQITYEGLVQAEQELGIKGTAVVAKSGSDYLPNMVRFARGGYDLVIGVGFLMTDAIKEAAQQYPDTKFLLIDMPIGGVPNLSTAIFASQEISFLAGALAAMVDQDKNVTLPIRHNGVISVVAGMQIPPVDIYMAGYFQGARHINPNIKVLYGYTGTFGDPAVGKQFALTQHSKGSDIVYQLAGGTGLGVIQASKENNFLSIGADSDQAYLAPNNVLTSTSKLCNVAVFQTIKRMQAGEFQSGVVVYDLKSGGVDVSPAIKGVPASITNHLEQIKQDIIAGRIKVSMEIPEWAKAQNQ